MENYCWKKKKKLEKEKKNKDFLTFNIYISDKRLKRKIITEGLKEISK